MTEFSFKFRRRHEERCGWCLDRILTLPEDRPTTCPYCGSDLSTKSPRYDEMMERIKHNSEMRQRDKVLWRLREYQFDKKNGLMDSKIVNIQMSPLVHITGRAFPVGEGSFWSGGKELQDLVESIHLDPNAPDIEAKKKTVLMLGKELYQRSGRDIRSMEIEFAQLIDDLTRKYTLDFDKYRSLWNGICDEWKY